MSAQPINPTQSSQRPINPILSDIAASLLNDDKSLVGTLVLPPTPFGTAQKSGTIFRTSVGAFFGDGNTQLTRSPGEPVKTSQGPGLETVTYIATQYARAAEVADEEVRDAQLDIWKLRLMQPVAELSIMRERNLLDVLGTSGNWTGSFTVGPAWTSSSADPAVDIATAQGAIDLYGRDPNTAVLSYAAYDALRKSNAFRERMPTNIDRNLPSVDYIRTGIAAMLGLPVDRVRIAKGTRNTANAGATPTLSRIAGAWMWLGYIELGQGATIQIPDMPGAVSTNATALLRLPVERPSVEEYRVSERRVTRANVVYEEAIQVVNAQLGCLISGIA